MTVPASSDHTSYRSPTYNETQARRDFIDPLLGALTVDKAFLREIEGWRELLARDIALWCGYRRSGG
ncbi:MAG: hypothetical protein SH847_08335 [Roseiflexaceae bacterium]|nr:hypothetical protein [Roseiflexaceae bacterium]